MKFLLISPEICVNYQAGKCGSEKTVFTLVSQTPRTAVPAILQPHNLTGKRSHQSSPAPCSRSGWREFKILKGSSYFLLSGFSCQKLG